MFWKLQSKSLKNKVADWESAVLLKLNLVRGILQEFLRRISPGNFPLRTPIFINTLFSETLGGCFRNKKKYVFFQDICVLVFPTVFRYYIVILYCNKITKIIVISVILWFESLYALNFLTTSDASGVENVNFGCIIWTKEILFGQSDTSFFELKVNLFMKIH